MITIYQLIIICIFIAVAAIITLSSVINNLVVNVAELRKGNDYGENSYSYVVTNNGADDLLVALDGPKTAYIFHSGSELFPSTSFSLNYTDQNGSIEIERFGVDTAVSYSTLAWYMLQRIGPTPDLRQTIFDILFNNAMADTDDTMVNIALGDRDLLFLI